MGVTKYLPIAIGNSEIGFNQKADGLACESFRYSIGVARHPIGATNFAKSCLSKTIWSKTSITQTALSYLATSPYYNLIVLKAKFLLFYVLKDFLHH